MNLTVGQLYAIGNLIQGLQDAEASVNDNIDLEADLVELTGEIYLQNSGTGQVLGYFVDHDSQWTFVPSADE